MKNQNSAQLLWQLCHDETAMTARQVESQSGQVYYAILLLKVPPRSLDLHLVTNNSDLTFRTQSQFIDGFSALPELTVLSLCKVANNGTAAVDLEMERDPPGGLLCSPVCYCKTSLGDTIRRCRTSSYLLCLSCQVTVSLSLMIGL